MNYYAFHIGDYSSATMHLTWDEDLAYRRLMDVYYMREASLPSDVKQVYRLARANSPAQRKAVDTVLAEFFALTEGGYANARCEAEIVTITDKSRKAKASADARWRNATAEARGGQGAQSTQEELNAELMRTHSEGNTPNPNPNPNPNLDEISLGRDSLQILETKLREAAGWQGEPAPKLFVTGHIQALIDAGADLEQDVLPTVRAIAPMANSRTSWNYFTKAIAQARDDRVAASDIKTTGRHDRNPANAKPRPHPVTIAAAKLRQDLGIGSEEVGHGFTNGPF